jgi:hypothetical protein
MNGAEIRQGIVRIRAALDACARNEPVSVVLPG